VIVHTKTAFAEKLLDLFFDVGFELTNLSGIRSNDSKFDSSTCNNRGTYAGNETLEKTNSDLSLTRIKERA
jgi:hypothetical protein